MGRALNGDADIMVHAACLFLVLGLSPHVTGGPLNPTRHPTQHALRCRPQGVMPDVPSSKGYAGGFSAQVRRPPAGARDVLHAARGARPAGVQPLNHRAPPSSPTKRETPCESGASAWLRFRLPLPLSAHGFATHATCAPTPAYTGQSIQA